MKLSEQLRPYNKVRDLVLSFPQPKTAQEAYAIYKEIEFNVDNTDLALSLCFAYLRKWKEQQKETAQ